MTTRLALVFVTAGRGCPIVPFCHKAIRDSKPGLLMERTHRKPSPRPCRLITVLVTV